MSVTRRRAVSQGNGTARGPRPNGLAGSSSERIFFVHSADTSSDFATHSPRPPIDHADRLSLVGSLVGPHDQGGQRPFHRGTLYDTHSHSLHDGADSRPLPRLDGVSTLSGLGRHARFGPGAQTMFPRSTGVSASRPPVAAAPPSFQPASGSTFQRFGFIGGASGLGGSGSAGGGTGGMVVQVARAAWAVLAVSSHGGYRLCM